MPSLSPKVFKRNRGRTLKDSMLAASPGKMRRRSHCGAWFERVRVNGKFLKHHAVQSMTSNVVSTNKVSKFSSLSPRRWSGTKSKTKSWTMSSATARKPRAMLIGWPFLELLRRRLQRRLTCYRQYQRPYMWLILKQETA